MATQKQKRAIQGMVENGGNVSKAMIEAGYSQNTAHTPSKLTNSDAFKEFSLVCRERGLNANLIVQALVEDIQSKPSERIQELALGSKLIGLFDKEKADQEIKTMMVPEDIAKRHNIKNGEVYRMMIFDRAFFIRKDMESPFVEDYTPSEEDREMAERALFDAK